MGLCVKYMSMQECKTKRSLGLNILNIEGY